MKTKKLWAVVLLFVASLGFSLAQTTNMQGIERPSKIDELLFAGKTNEAVAEFENFKKEQQQNKGIDPFDMAFMELSFYRDLSMRGGWMFPMSDETKQQYTDKFTLLKQQLIKKFPNRVETYLIQCEFATMEDIVKYTTKAISVDPESVDAYRMRATAYRELGKVNEAKSDEEKVASLEKQKKESQQK